MATRADHNQLDRDGRIARMARLVDGAVGDRARARRRAAETRSVPYSMIVQAMPATAAPPGAGAASAGLLFP